MAAYTTIDDSGSFFKPKLFTGTGSSLGVTGVGFQPDFTWIKNRDAGDFHVVTDAVRGVTKYIRTNSTDAESTDAESLKTFDSDGFTVGTQAEVNTNTENYASWNWIAGTTTGIAGSPSITPTAYSFNATSGFSIIKWAGTAATDTLPHGLGVAPTMIIVKNLTAGADWYMYNTNLANTQAIRLSNPAAVETQSYWQDTTADATIFYISAEANVNGSGQDYVAYCYAEKQGYSKFGVYAGNGNADGPFCYCGFVPSLVITKNIDATGEWNMYTSTTELSTNTYLYANLDYAEGSGVPFDFLSNGFKIKTDNADRNASGNDFIYIAFAEAPFVNSSGVPGNARASTF